MAIDREMYEKYSGRKIGEAERRLGESIADRSRRLEGLKSWRDRPFQERYFIVGLGWEVVIGAIFALALIAAALIRWVF